MAAWPEIAASRAHQARAKVKPVRTGRRHLTSHQHRQPRGPVRHPDSFKPKPQVGHFGTGIVVKRPVVMEDPGRAEVDHGAVMATWSHYDHRG